MLQGRWLVVRGVWVRRPLGVPRLLSDAGLDLMTRMLSLNPDTRISASEALRRPRSAPRVGGERFGARGKAVRL